MSDYRNVIREIKTVSSLLEKVEELDEHSGNISTLETAWVAPMDTWKTRKQYSVYSEQVNSTPDGAEGQRITRWVTMGPWRAE